jgi:hypothetical protein
MLRLSNGLALELIAESGAIGFGKDWWPERISKMLRWPSGPWRGLPLHDWRLFDAVVLKTITFSHQKGNINSYSLPELAKVIRPITKSWLEGSSIRKSGFWRWLKDSFTIVGWLNAIGLRNPGLYKFLESCPALKKRTVTERLNIIVSIAPQNEKEAAVMTQELNPYGFAGLVYNTKDQKPEVIVRLTSIIREESQLPLMVKFDPDHPIKELVLEVKDFAEAVFINAVRFKDRFPEREDPFQRFGGGRVSGEVAHLKTWPRALEATRVGVLPVVWPIWEYDDILLARSQGAAAFSMASRFILFPWKANGIARRWKQQKMPE